MEISKATPIPWKAVRMAEGVESTIYGANDTVIARGVYYENAEAICLAVNSNPGLVKALRPFFEYIKCPNQPIHAVIRPEEWKALWPAMKAAGVS